jgi:hypothetical protein
VAQGDLQGAIDRLYAVPLDEFTGERTRLARELRSGGDRSAADEIAKLRKPSPAAWALNLVAREEAGAVEEWLAATEALRDASTHAAEVGGDALRAAMAEHRAATAHLMEVVRGRARPGGRPLSNPMLERVRALLQSATVDAALAERVRAGRVTEDKAAPEVPPLPEPKPGRQAGRARRRPPKRDRDAAARRAELERRVAAAREEAERLREEAARRSAAADAADERLEEARRTLHRSRSESEAAREAVKDAEAAAAAAGKELEKLQARLRA